MRPSISTTLIVPATIVCLLLAATYFIYYPGLGGPFILDDAANLSGLAQVGDIGNYDGIIRYLFSDLSHSRPLSKLSFLINDVTWPTSPYGFKHTNLLLHLVNGLLIFIFLLKITRMLGASEMHCQLIAAIAAGAWLLHPLNVSTTLYVVQRMTQLSTLFMLIGILMYLQGRAMVGRRALPGYIWMSSGIALGTTLGFLSKENGILLPLYVYVLEAFLLRPDAAIAPYWRQWKIVFLLCPALFIAGWLVISLPDLLKGYAELREFTMGQRLLTETRVLSSYLYGILLPHRAGSGVFHDDYPMSVDLFTPLSTVFSLAFILTLLVSAVKLRKSAHVYSFAVLWFFAGHILESSVIPLELYFEHRNYLPMVGVLFALAYYAISSSSRVRTFVVAGAGLFVAFSALVTWQSARLWGDVVESALVWEQEHPTSVRALQHASNLWISIGNDQESRIRIEKIGRLRPNWAAPRLELIYLSCVGGKSDQQDAHRDLIHVLRTVEWDPATANIVGKLLKSIVDGSCVYPDLEAFDQILDALISNPLYRKRRPTMADLYLSKAKAHERRGDRSEQITALRESFSWTKNWHVAIEESRLLAELGRFNEALSAVQRAKSLYKVRVRGIQAAFESDETLVWETYLKSRGAAAGAGSN